MVGAVGVERIEIAKLVLVPGDIFVVKVPTTWSAEYYQHLANQIGGNLPDGVRLLMLPAEAELSVLTPRAARAPDAMRLC